MRSSITVNDRMQQDYRYERGELVGNFDSEFKPDLTPAEMLAQTKQARHSNMKPATRSEMKPATWQGRSRPRRTPSPPIGWRCRHPCTGLPVEAKRSPTARRCWFA